MDEIKMKSDFGTISFTPKLALQEYFIDLLGGLVPGILFITANCMILLPSFFALVNALSGSDKACYLSVTKFIFTSIQNMPSAFWFVFLTGILFLSYTIGHLFYRRDPNDVDKESYKILEKSLKSKNKHELSAELGCDSVSKCEFPYEDYHKYLEKRKLDYLKPFALWTTDDESEKEKRSKAYINILKIKLMYYHPEKCATIIRNEAHVRLAASNWYVSKTLTCIGIFGTSISVLALIYSLFNDKRFDRIDQALAWYLIPILCPLCVTLFSLYFKNKILKFFHYQRLREIFFVLETAYNSAEESPKIWRSFLVRFSKNSKKY